MVTSAALEAYALGYYHGRAFGVDSVPDSYNDSAVHFYRRGYDAGVSDYCREAHNEEDELAEWCDERFGGDF